MVLKNVGTKAGYALCRLKASSASHGLAHATYSPMEKVAGSLKSAFFRNQFSTQRPCPRRRPNPAHANRGRTLLRWRKRNNISCTTQRDIDHTGKGIDREDRNSGTPDPMFTDAQEVYERQMLAEGRVAGMGVGVKHPDPEQLLYDTIEDKAYRRRYMRQYFKETTMWAPEPGTHQQTLRTSFVKRGVGLHSGASVTVRVSPAFAGEGRYFVPVPVGSLDAVPEDNELNYPEWTYDDHEEMLAEFYRMSMMTPAELVELEKELFPEKYAHLVTDMDNLTAQHLGLKEHPTLPNYEYTEEELAALEEEGVDAFQPPKDAVKAAPGEGWVGVNEDGTEDPDAGPPQERHRPQLQRIELENIVLDSMFGEGRSERDREAQLDTLAATPGDFNLEVLIQEANMEWEKKVEEERAEQEAEERKAPPVHDWQALDPLYDPKVPLVSYRDLFARRFGLDPDLVNETDREVLPCPAPTAPPQGHPDEVRIPADMSSVPEDTSSMLLCTKLQAHGITISTVEHILAALECCGVDNARIEIDSLSLEDGECEMPIMDGSAEDWVRGIEWAGTHNAQDRDGLEVERQALKPSKPVMVADGDSFIMLQPAPAPRFTCSIDFAMKSVAIGKQSLCWSPVEDDHFAFQVGMARTFATMEDVEHARQAGLAKGGSVDNALIAMEYAYYNEPRRYEDECVRHKLLDLLGDLALMARPGHSGLPIGHIVAYKAGHKLHLRFAKELMDACSEDDMAPAVTRIPGSRKVW